MKTDFFMKETRHSNLIFPTTMIIAILAIFLFTKSVNIYLLLLQFLLIFTIFFDIKKNKSSGVYINKTDILYKNVFSKKNIDITSIDCIRILPDRNIAHKNHSEIIKDEKGNILFCMYFYHNYYEKDELDGYDFIEEIKRFFVERQICHCIYDKEALDYILTLNPNIKVVYYDKH